MESTAKFDAFIVARNLMLLYRAVRFMNGVGASTLTDTSEDTAGFAQALYFRLAIREQAKIQSSFLRLLSSSGSYQHFVLCGGAALHGVCLHKRRSSNIDLYAPQAIIGRFEEIARGCGVGLAKGKIPNSYMLNARILGGENLITMNQVFTSQVYSVMFAHRSRRSEAEPR